MHCIIGAVLGTAIANSLLAGQFGRGIDWTQTWSVLRALAFSPVLGFFLAACERWGAGRSEEPGASQGRSYRNRRIGSAGALLTVQAEKGSKERNDRLMAVPINSRPEHSLNSARDLPAETREELEKFFIATDELEDKKLKFEGWVGPEQALRLLKESERRFAKTVK